MSEQTPQRTTLTINWLQIAGGAGAAVTSAFLLASLKSLGTYGTLVGAALGSVIASTAAAVYGHYLNVSRERVVEAARRARERRTGPVPPAQDEHPDRTEPPVGDGEPAPGPAPVPGPQRRRFRARHAVLLGVAAFVLSVGGIFVVESVSGTSVAATVQGDTATTEKGIFGNELPRSTPTPTPVDTGTATPEATGTESATATDTATATESATGSATESATSSPTATGEDTATGSPSATATSSGRSTGPSSPTASSDAAGARATAGAEAKAATGDQALTAPTGTATAAP